MSEKRITPISFCGMTLDADVDLHWSNLLADPFDAQVLAVSDEFHWLIVLHWMPEPHEVKEKFWLSYRELDAAKARDVAMKGLAWVNFKRERDLLNNAIWWHEQYEEAQAKGTVAEDGSVKAGLMLLGKEFASLVANLDHKAFAKMSQIIRAQGTPVSDKPRGGEDSPAGQMLREFVSLHLASRSLPTKKQLREACGLADDPDRARELMKELGLSGLPQHPL